MSDPKRAGSGHSASSLPDNQEYLVRRDGDRPLSFAGARLACANREKTTGLMALSDIEVLEAALYRTRGGKFITSLTKTVKSPMTALRRMNAIAMVVSGVDEEDSPQSFKGEYFKGALHDTFEDAVMWFKPGKLTDEIRRQLGLDEPIRID